MVATYKKIFSNSKTVLYFCKKIDFEHLTKLVYTLRIHQSFISESFTNHIHQISEQLNFESRNLLREF